MNFFIRKKSTLPVLKMQLIRDGRLDFHKFATMLETSTIVFSMVNRDTGIYKISQAPATIMLREAIGDEDPEYYIAYKFTERDTNEEGVYYGEFKVINSGMCPDDEFNIGSLKMPVREELFIHILESYIN